MVKKIQNQNPHCIYKPFLLFLWDWVWKNAASHSSWCGEVKNGWWRVLFELGEKSPRVLGRRPHNAREKETMLNETNIKTKSLFCKCFFLACSWTRELSMKSKGAKQKVPVPTFTLCRVCVCDQAIIMKSWSWYYQNHHLDHDNHNPDKVRRMFTRADKDGNGTLTKEEWHHVLNSSGCKTSMLVFVYSLMVMFFVIVNNVECTSSWYFSKN